VNFKDSKRTNTNEKSLYRQVNEVGHSKLYNQNVWIKEDNRTVRYFFKAELQLGKAVELLTDYKSTYEKVREKRGYGLRNIREGVRSNSSDSDRLQRGIADRYDVEVAIDSTDSIARLRYLLHFIETSIWLPIIGRIDALRQAYHGGTTPALLSPAQWVATRRIYWIAEKVLHKVERMKGTVTDRSVFGLYEWKIKEQLRANKARFATSVQPALNLESVILDKGVALALEYEQIEEICYGVRGQLHMVKDDSVYCEIANSLIDKLCRHTASLRSVELVGNENAVQKALAHFYDAAREAKGEIIECIKKCEFARLQFTCGVLNQSSLKGNTECILAKVRTSYGVFLQNSTLPKGIVAALREKLHYEEMNMLAGLPVHDTSIASAISNRLVMKRCEGLTEFGDLNDLASVPADVSRINLPSDINGDWYVLTQVVWIVDVFASHYLKGSLYSIGELAKVLDVNTNHAKFVVERGLRIVSKETFRDFLTGKTKPLLQELEHVNNFQEKPQPAKRRQGVSKRVKNDETRTSVSNARTPLTKHAFNSSSSPASIRRAPKLVYEGAPTSKFPLGGKWPEGWIQRTYERQGGASKGHTDDYWFAPPDGKPRLRSTLEIIRYFGNLRTSEGP
jgi:hypothetical protein